MSNTKKQLMTAIAMLVVAALALGTSTYAWFVSNTTVKVDSMTFTAQTVDDLQIALTTDAWTGALSGTSATPDIFKTLITSAELNALYTSKGAVLTGAALIPASTINAATFYKVADGAASWEVNGSGVNIAKTFEQTNNITENCVKAIPLYLKSTTATSVFLGTNTTVTGQASPAVRVAFAVEGGSTIIWAPDAAGAIDDNKITTIDGADGITKAVDSASTVGTITGYTDTKPTSAIATLEAGVAKRIIVYIWLEGCDKDCVSGLSAKDLTVNLEFTSQNS